MANDAALPPTKAAEKEDGEDSSAFAVAGGDVTDRREGLDDEPASSAHVVLGAVSETSIILTILLRSYAGGQSDAFCTAWLLFAYLATCSSMCLLSALSQLDLINATTAVAQSAPAFATTLRYVVKKPGKATIGTRKLRLTLPLLAIAALAAHFLRILRPTGRL